VNEQERAAFRAFVRDHHPDRGGDPDVFIAGVAHFRGAGHGPPEPPEGGADDSRFDAPVEVVTPLPVPVRVALALLRTLRWHRDRRVQ